METHMILYGELTKVEALADGSLRVHGVASTGARDTAGEIVSPEAMRRALPDYLAFGAIREMHQPRAAGAALSAEVDAEGATRIAAHIVDPVAVAKVRAGVYKGLSIGGKVLGRDPRDASVITALRLDEISLVDRPCNPEAVIDLWKAAAPTGGVPTNDQVKAEAERLARAAGKPGRRNDFLVEARMGLTRRASFDTAASPPAQDEVAKGGSPLARAEAGGTAPSRPIPAPHAEEQPGRAASRSTQAPPAADPPHLQPEGDVSQAPHGSFADPLAAKYPLDTAERIRAAWSAIASPTARAGYAAEALADMEAKIAAAWRARIDPAGPPSADPPSAEPPPTEAPVPPVAVTAAAAPASAQPTAGKAAAAQDLRKLADLERDLAAARAEAADLTKRLDAQAAEIERLGRQPLPPRAAASPLAKAIGKAEDSAGAAGAAHAPVASIDLVRVLEALSPGERAHLLMKAALARPIPLA